MVGELDLTDKGGSPNLVSATYGELPPRTLSKPVAERGM
jgi:hypothetical protein